MAPPTPATPAATHSAWAFLTPALVLLAVSVLIPAAMALVISFTRTGLDVSEPLTFVGLANFRRLVADPMLLRVTGTTFLYLVGVVPPIVLGSLALAVLVNRQLPGIAALYGTEAVLLPLSSRDALAVTGFAALLGWLGAWLAVSRHLWRSGLG